MLSFLSASAAPDSLSEIRELTEQKRFTRALQSLDEFLDNYPNHLEGRLYRGVILTRQGQLDKAIEAFDELAREHPELPEPHNNLAVLYAAQNRYDEARSALLKAIELQPRYDTAHENLGDVYAKLASNAYDRAYQLNSRNTRAYNKAKLLTKTFEVRDSPRASEPLPAVVELSESQGESAHEASSAAAGAETSPTPEPAQMSKHACYTVGGFDSEPDLLPVSQWLDKKGATATARTREEQRQLGYRVYLPPLESRVAAAVQIERMKGEGITDIVRISDGELDDGIALGVYRTEAAARRRAAKIRASGYQPDVAPRYESRETWVLDVKLEAGAAADPATFAQSFPNLHLEETPCG